MSTDKNKATIRTWFETLNTRDVNQLEALTDEYYTPDFILHGPLNFPNLAVGVEGLKHHMRLVLKGWENSPDAHITIDDMVAEGDKVAFRFTVHRLDVSTGKPIRIPHLAISRFVGDKIAEEWEV